MVSQLLANHMCTFSAKIRLRPWNWGILKPEMTTGLSTESHPAGHTSVNPIETQVSKNGYHELISHGVALYSAHLAALYPISKLLVVGGQRTPCAHTLTHMHARRQTIHNDKTRK